MGFTPAQLAALRRMAEGFFDTSALILTPRRALDDLGEPVPDAYDSQVHPARFERRDRMADQGAFPDARREIADWAVSLAHDVSISVRDVVLPGAAAWRGNWSASETYAEGDAVKLGGRYFVAKQATANPLVDGDSWSEVLAFEVSGVNASASNRVRIIADLKLLA